VGDCEELVWLDVLLIAELCDGLFFALGGDDFGVGGVEENTLVMVSSSCVCFGHAWPKAQDCAHQRCSVSTGHVDRAAVKLATVCRPHIQLLG
jgi:hypothetical protein